MEIIRRFFFNNGIYSVNSVAHKVLVILNTWAFELTQFFYAKLFTLYV